MANRVLNALCVFFILPVILCGCGKDRESVVTDFTADFTAEYRAMSLSGKLTSDRRGLFNIEITSPDTLGGIGINIKNGVTELKKGELSCTADEAYLPQSSFPSLMKTALEALSDEVVNNGVSPKNGKIAVEKNGRTFEIFTDGNGYITKITLSGELEAELSGVSASG